MIKRNISLSGEKILLIGLFFTPFTSLRFSFLGPGEILIILAVLIAVVNNNFSIRIDKRIRVFYRFWYLFLSIALIGVYFNNFFAYVPSGKIDTMIFDLFAYIFILLTVYAIGHYASLKPDFTETFFQKLFIYWAITYSVLFFISFFTPSILGMPLRYYHYFVPLVENVHQASMVTMAMCFVMFYLGLKTEGILIKSLFFISATLFASMALTSGSTKAMLGIVVGLLVGIIHLVGYRTSGKLRVLINAFTFFICLSFLIIILYLFTDELIFLAIQFFTENDGSSARESLYLSGFQSALNSPLVGYGPGAHVPWGNGYSDAHNSTLTILLQAGIIGVLVFVWFNLKIISKLSVHFALFSAIAAIGMYIIGGDILRRLPIWVILIGLYYFSIYPSWRPKLKTIKQI